MIAHRTQRPSLLALLAVLGAAAACYALAGCGANAYQVTEKTVTVADQVQAQAAAAFPDFDKAAEQAIVDKGRAAGQADDQIRAQLAAHRTIADKVIAGLAALADASHAVKAGLEAFGQGKIDFAGVAPLLGKMYAVALDLAAQARALGWTIPGIDKLLPPNAFTQPSPIARRSSIDHRVIVGRSPPARGVA